MKITTKVILVIAAGAFVIYFLYPAMHEAGHIITAYFLQIEVVSYSVLPVAQVSLALYRPTAKQLLLLSFGADVLFPALWLIPWKNMLFYYVKLTASIMFFFDAVGSLMNVILYDCGGECAYDDAVVVLMSFPDLDIAVLMILTVETIMAGSAVLLLHPIKNTIGYLQKNTQTSERLQRFV